MRIAVMAPDLCNGSVAGVALRHARELSARHTVHVITRKVPPDLPAKIGRALVRPASWNWLRRYGHVPNELAFAWSARRALARLSEHECPDVVWCHSHALAALVAAPLKERFGFRVLMTTHGDIFDRPKGTYSPELTRFYRAVTPRAYRKSDAVQVLSPYMGSLAMKHGAPSDRVRVIPNGVDPLDIGLARVVSRPADSFMPRGQLRLLYVGSLWNVKGMDVLLHAAAALRPMNLEVTFIGEGPQRQALQSLAAALGLANSVIFRGRVGRQELAAHYAAADVLCVPSLSEALSTVTLEAMLCGLPVVGSNTGGIPFLVLDNQTGYLAVAGNSASLAECIRKAAVSRDHLAALGARGLARARDDFGWAAIADQLSALAEASISKVATPGKLASGAVR